tara:strand:+ start:84 stop:371 length:288 start_codon:yes stop_codon:yes gene_type:complete
MTNLNAKSAHVVRAAACFHCDNARRYGSKDFMEPVALHPLAVDYRSTFIHSCKAAAVFAQINAQNRDVHVVLLLNQTPHNISGPGRGAVHPIRSV